MEPIANALRATLGAGDLADGVANGPVEITASDEELAANGAAVHDRTAGLDELDSVGHDNLTLHEELAPGRTRNKYVEGLVRPGTPLVCAGAGPGRTRHPHT